MVGIDLGPKRKSCRDRTKTMKAIEQGEAVLFRDEYESNASGAETTIRVSATPPDVVRHDLLELLPCLNQRIQQRPREPDNLLRRLQSDWQL